MLVGVVTLAGLMVTAVSGSTGLARQCQYGSNFMDECGSSCVCFNGATMCFKRMPCMPGQRPKVALTCHDAERLPRPPGWRVFCQNGIVRVLKPGRGTRNLMVLQVSGSVQQPCSVQPVDTTVWLLLDVGCPHGPIIIDQCNNDCICVGGKSYACTKNACAPGQTPEAPMACKKGYPLPVRPGYRISCLNDTVTVQTKGHRRRKVLVIHLSGGVQQPCEVKPTDRITPTLSGRGDTEFCAGETECPADCGFVSRNEKCIFCQCGPGPLEPGEVVVGIKEPCPPGTVPGTFEAFTKTCKPAPAGSSCKFGPAYIDECNNDCSCVDNKLYACTKKACKPGLTAAEPQDCTNGENLPKRTRMRVFCHQGITKLQRLDAKCLPGAEFLDKDNCNTCTCSDTGVAACTMKHCGTNEAGRGDTEFCAGETECPADCGFVSRNEKCIFCQCGPGPLAPGEVFVGIKEPCPPGTVPGTFQAYTKTCKPAPVGSGCKFGPAYIDECNNDCSCVDNKLYACTKKSCKPGLSAAKPLECTNGENLPKRARMRVFCHEGIIKLQRLDAKCLPGAQFLDKDNCNTCTCSDTGVAACTMKHCGTNEVDEGCPHGPIFIDQCDSDCLCMYGKSYACWEKACKPGTTAKVPMACKAGGSLPVRSQHRVICHNGIVKVQNKDAGCLPKATFKEDCNNCTCSDTGVPECTQKVCDIMNNKDPRKACRGRSGGCPAGFWDCGGRCLALLKRQVSHSAAVALCASRGAQLAVPRSERQIGCARQLVGTSEAWLGVVSLHGELHGLDGAGPLPDAGPQWAPGEPRLRPAAPGHRTDCIQIWGRRGWDDTNCQHKKHPLCQAPACA